MLRKSLLRGLSSYCGCVTVTVFVSMISGLCGACYPELSLLSACPGGAVASAYLQPLLIGLIGFAFGAGSVLFEIERWSFLRQGAAHLALTAAVWIPVELICFRPITPPVIASFTASAFATYAITWTVQYFVWRARVRRINEQIRHRNEESQP